MSDEKDPGLETLADARSSTSDSGEGVGTRQGMFGVAGTGDTSGYGGLVAPVRLPGSAARPFGGWYDEVADALESTMGLENVVIHRGEITFHVRREDLPAVAKMLRDEQRFEFCAGVNGVHYPDDTGRELHAVYHLLSMTHNRRIRLEVTCPDADPHIPSIVAL
jgi:NADH-quinone oxidoreductase subunit C